MRIGIDLSSLQAGNLSRGIGIYAENLLLALDEISRDVDFVLFTSGPIQKIFRYSALTRPQLRQLYSECRAFLFPSSAP